MLISNTTLPVKPDKIADMVDAVNNSIQAAKAVFEAAEMFDRQIHRFKGKSEVAIPLCTVSSLSAKRPSRNGRTGTGM